uniref:DDE Tnp4 domain-containing protein n=1 Tax=Salmo trutta TaxID=8032 RepID=A0A674BAI2_SALTR
MGKRTQTLDRGTLPRRPASRSHLFPVDVETPLSILVRASLHCSVKKRLEAIERRMLATHLPRPTEETWRHISQEFNEKWDLPNCLGLVDGKHIMITKPANSRSRFFYNKGTFSMVLLALVDAKYRFTAIQVGGFERNSDGGVYANSPLGRSMASKTLMIVEKAFRILAARWRILYKKINQLASKFDTRVVAMCILHNFLTKPCDVEMCLQQSGAGMRQDMRSIAIQANRAGQDAVCQGKVERFSPLWQAEWASRTEWL